MNLFILQKAQNTNLIFLMGIFHQINNLVVIRYWWLILLIKIWLFLNQCNLHQNFSKILTIPNLCLFFLKRQWLLSFKQFCEFLLNKSFKTHLGPFVPPGGRKIQLNYLNFINIGFLVEFTFSVLPYIGKYLNYEDMTLLT